MIFFKRMGINQTSSQQGSQPLQMYGDQQLWLDKGCFEKGKRNKEKGLVARLVLGAKQRREDYYPQEQR